MSLLKYKLLQAYTGTWYPDNFKLNTKYFRIHVGTSWISTNNAVDLELKTYLLGENGTYEVPAEYEDLYYIMGTTDTYSTTDTKIPTGYVWKKYTGPIQFKHTSDNNAKSYEYYIYLCRKSKYYYQYNIPGITDNIYNSATGMKIVSNISLGTYFDHPFEIQGEMASLIEGDNITKWDTCNDYDIFFGGSNYNTTNGIVNIGSSNFRSAKDLILNDINVARTYPSFANCTSLKDANITIKDSESKTLTKLSDYKIKSSKISSNGASLARLFPNTGVTNVTLNLLYDGGSTTNHIIESMFSNCKYLTSATINCSKSSNQSYFSGNPFIGMGTTNGVFKECPIINTIDLPNLPDLGQISSNSLTAILGSSAGSSVKNKYIGLPVWNQTQTITRDGFISSVNNRVGVSGDYAWKSQTSTVNGKKSDLKTGQSGTQLTIKIKMADGSIIPSTNTSSVSITCLSDTKLSVLRDIICGYNGVYATDSIVKNNKLYLKLANKPDNMYEVRVYSRSWGGFTNFQIEQTLNSALSYDISQDDYISLHLVQ